MTTPLSRRHVLRGLAAGAGLAMIGCRPSWPERAKRPGDRPFPDRPEGADCLPQVEHIVIYMQENHSYDSYFGTLRRGDGYRMRHGVPTNRNDLPDGTPFGVFHADSTCQTGRGVSQNWNSTHVQMDGGRMDGFLRDGNTNAMKYWDGDDLPFYWSLASTFPLCDRWFTSAPCQTYPNRLYLQAATSSGLVSTDTGKILAMAPPANGTIWERLNDHGITWNDYAWDLPDILLVPSVWQANQDRVKTFDQFLSDCRGGTLPQVSIVSPGVTAYSEENPADVQLGEAYSASIINAVMQSPCWSSTVLLFMYDEHGGYYDHVPPPAAYAPDAIPPDPDVAVQPGDFQRYGPRVPGFVVSPFAKRHYVSHVRHDHTSVLKLIETKFNLGALTYRDANASNLLDCLDLRGHHGHRPPFLDPPELAAPGLPATGSSCSATPPPPTEPATGAAARYARAVPTGLGAPVHTLPSAEDPSLTDTQAERVKLLDAVTVRP